MSFEGVYNLWFFQKFLQGASQAQAPDLHAYYRGLNDQNRVPLKEFIRVLP